jgi:methylisocitrate lyase
MTEFGKTPFFSADEFQAMGYRMVIWPVSSLRVAAKAQGELYSTIRRDGGAEAMLNRMQTRAELYETIGYAEYEALDQTIISTILPGETSQK